MANFSQPHPFLHRLSELVVPALMIAGVGLYAYNSIHLSIPALILPGALIAVIVVALLWALASSFRGRDDAETGDAAAKEWPQGPLGLAMHLRPWLLVLLPALIVLSLEVLGAMAALVALVFGAQLFFDARAPLKSLLIAVLVAVPTHALFEHVLYVRFPAGLLGLG